ncbi:hypothetical protein [Actinacidiphila epipremni]|uniref:Uncharacterized protein n=1 Tax=Actinacidiphila epipremni TaxID=2053013 RepID=A0ABX1A367_9ACTN|nr:hypothetical protein [Actinacidiphila epipremni]NJP48226.1 hypothetical protein [Actinacidiphila epipremni]
MVHKIAPAASEQPAAHEAVTYSSAADTDVFSWIAQHAMKEVAKMAYNYPGKQTANDVYHLAKAQSATRLCMFFPSPWLRTIRPEIISLES